MKKIKAWMILGLEEYGQIPTLFRTRAEAKKDIRFSLPHYIAKSENRVVPVTIIIPTLPKRKKNTKTV